MQYTKKTYISLLFLLLTISLACSTGGGSSSNKNTPTPALNKIYIYHDTTRINTYDTLRLENREQITLNLKFYDSTSNTEISYNNVKKYIIEWNSSSFEILVDQKIRNSAQITGAKKGSCGLTATIYAGAKAVKATVQIKVFNPNIKKIDLSPKYAVVNVNTIKKFGLTAIDMYDMPISFEDFSWYIFDTTRAKIESIISDSFEANIRTYLPDNYDTASTTIFATAVDKTGMVFSNTATLKVVKPEVVVKKVEIFPSEVYIILGGGKKYYAIARDIDNNIIENSIFKWVTETPSVAAFDDSSGVFGNLKTKALGVNTVYAKMYNSVDSTYYSANSILYVVDSTAIKSIAMDPNQDQILDSGDNKIFSATAYNAIANGKVIEGVTFKWQSSDESVATIDADNGVLEAKNNGKATITVTAPGGLTLSVDVTVLANEPTKHYVKRFAGKGENPGLKDTVKNEAQFNLPYGIVVDRNETYYIADAGNNQIRKIDNNGNVSYLAGDQNGKDPIEDVPDVGQAIAARESRFNNPHGITVDHAGIIYVADTQNYRIRKIITGNEPVVVTIAGVGSAGLNIGVPGAEAKFGEIHGITIDNYEKPTCLFAADATNNCIYKINLLDTTLYTVVLFAGQLNASGHLDTTNLKALFNKPKGLIADTYMNELSIYVADTGNNRIRKISNDVVTTIAGTSESGFQDGKTGKFNEPEGITIDDPVTVGGSGDKILYVADTGNNAIRRINLTRVDNKDQATVSTIAGPINTGLLMSGYNGDIEVRGDEAKFRLPVGITVRHFTEVIVADTNNHVIRSITK
ncbi:Ig-like domain-containing protein [Candidatus Poribacteria bacterium]|nr:Ig-like domain-containing protein [Candidatus Poribacteria bacterium]